MTHISLFVIGEVWMGRGGGGGGGGGGKGGGGGGGGGGVHEVE